MGFFLWRFRRFLLNLKQKSKLHYYALLICAGVIVIILSSILLLEINEATDVTERWSKTFGGPNADWGNSVQQTIDEEYIIIGNTDFYGTGNDDILLIKTDKKGNKMWNKTFGGPEEDWGNSVQQTIDEGYIIIGRTYSYGIGNNDIWLIKTDKEGNELWNKTFGGLGSDIGNSVRQTTDEGYIIIGSTKSYSKKNYDIWLIKTDKKGNKLWDKTFGESYADHGYSVQQTSDDGYIIIGTISDPGPILAGIGICRNIWLIKTDPHGNKLWDKTFGANLKFLTRYLDDQNNDGRSIQQTRDEGYIITGSTNSHGAGNDDIWLIKTDKKGNKLWDKTFGGPDADWGNSVQQTMDGGYIICGGSYFMGAERGDLWMIKTDKKGNKLWDKTFGGPDADWGNSVQQTMDGGYIIAGSTMSYGEGISDIWLIKTDACGRITLN